MASKRQLLTALASIAMGATFFIVPQMAMAQTTPDGVLPFTPTPGSSRHQMWQQYRTWRQAQQAAGTLPSGGGSWFNNLTNNGTTPSWWNGTNGSNWQQNLSSMSPQQRHAFFRHMRRHQMFSSMNGGNGFFGGGGSCSGNGGGGFFGGGGGGGFGGGGMPPGLARNYWRMQNGGFNGVANGLHRRFGF